MTEPKFTGRIIRQALGKERNSDDDGVRRDYGHRPKVSLARVHFLERPYPDWWNEKDPPRQPKVPAQRKRKRTVKPATPSPSPPSTPSDETR